MVALWDGVDLMVAQQQIFLIPVMAVPLFVALDPATVASVTLQSNNLAALTTGSTTETGARIPAASSKLTGKHYFELTMLSAAGGANNGFGVCTTASTYTGMGNSATSGAEMYFSSGNIWSAGSFVGRSLGARAINNVIGMAADLDNRRSWWKLVSGTPGNWNGDAAANPATNVNGVVIPAGSVVPVFTANSVSANVLFNFGAAAFTGLVPAGFNSGWTI
jgi:hypothetical protein